MSVDTAALLKRFAESPDSAFTSEEGELLARAAPSNVQAAKIAALHYFKSKDFERCIELTKLIFEREKDHENAVNLAVVLREAGKPDAAVAFLSENESVLESRTFHDLMCSCLARLGRIEEAVRHGNQSLKLKDAASKVGPRSPPLITRPFNVNAQRRNVIAFSVFGANTRYLVGAVNNACVARYLYPGWTARFYTDSSTPDGFRQSLKRNGAEVIMLTDLPAATYGLFWRFLVEED